MKVAEVARWAKGIEGVHECIAGRMKRPELMLDPATAQPVERKNGNWRSRRGTPPPNAGAACGPTYLGRRPGSRRSSGTTWWSIDVWSSGGGRDGISEAGEPVRWRMLRQYSGRRGGSRTARSGYFCTYAAAPGTDPDGSWEPTCLGCGLMPGTEARGRGAQVAFRTRRNWPGGCWSGRWNRECPSAGSLGTKSTATTATCGGGWRATTRARR